MKERIILTLLAVCLFAIATAQPEPRRITVNEGLPRNGVYAVVQGSRGPLYIGTWDGLYSYDGAEVREVVFTPSPQTPVRTVTGIAEAPDGKIWLATSVGVAVYNPETDSLTDIVGPTGNIVSLAVADNGEVAFVEDFRRLYTCDPAGNLLSSDGFAQVVFRRTDGSVCALSAEQVGLPEGETILSAIDSGSDTIYATTASGAVLCLPPSEKAREIGRAEWARALSEYNGLILIGSNDGLAAYNPTSGEFDPDGKALGIQARAVTSLSVDAENGLWIGTFYGGVIYKPAMADNFSAYKSVNDRLLGKVISGITRDSRGILWFGIEDGGVSSYDPLTDVVSNFPAGSNLPLSPSAANVQTVYCDSLTLYVGMAGGGMDIFDLQSGARRNFSRADGLPGSVYAFSPTGRKGEMYVGTVSGLYLFSPTDNNRIKRIEEIPPEIVHSLTPDSDGSVWVPTQGAGLYRIRPSGRVDSFRLESDMIMSVCPVDSVVYVGTEGHGLYVLNPRTGALRALSALPGRLMVFKIMTLDRLVWFSTNKGLMSLEPESGRLRRFTHGDGLTTNQFKINSGYIVDGQTLLMGSINGVNAVTPSKLKLNVSRPRAYITDFLVANDATGGDSHLFTDSVVTLPRESDNIGFRFASSSFSNPENNRFDYMLEPMQKSWHTVVGPVQSANFTNLSPGTYTFRLRTDCGNGLTSDEVRVQVVIKNYWWLTWPMVSLYVIVLLCLALWGAKMLIEKIKRDAQAAARLQAAAEAANREFLRRLREIVDRRMAESDLTIDALAAEMGLGRSNFYRAVKELTGQTPNEYLRTIRLERAAEMMRNGETRINEVCYRVGFASPSYFSKRFTAHFGLSPTDFLRNH